LSDFSTLSSDIFTLPLGFDSLCLSVFKVQSESNPVYKAFLDGLGVNPSSILKPADIPFLPIEFFKSQRVLTGSKEAQLIFSSSGTTGTVQSRHYVSEPHIYSESYLRAFQLFYGNPEEYCILALLPSYLEREGSSLILMTEDLIRRSKKADSGFYLNDRAALYTKLQAQEERGQKTILLGVTYALLEPLQASISLILRISIPVHLFRPRIWAKFTKMEALRFLEGLITAKFADAT
jgi:hypothetical protein